MAPTLDGEPFRPDDYPALAALLGRAQPGQAINEAMGFVKEPAEIRLKKVMKLA